jgi:uncharacterized protein (DUF849 family)
LFVVGRLGSTHISAKMVEIEDNEKFREETEKERKHRESYEKDPVEPDEYCFDEEQLIEAWKDL